LQGHASALPLLLSKRGVVGSPTHQYIDGREQKDEGDSAEDEVSKGHVRISVFLMGRIVPISYRRLKGLLTPSGRYLALASEFVSPPKRSSVVVQ
jgi:hypothetical protein